MIKVNKKLIFAIAFLLCLYFSFCFVSKIKWDIKFANNYPDTILVENNKDIEDIKFDKHQFVKIQELNNDSAALLLFNKIHIKEIKIKRIPEKEVSIGGDIVAFYGDGGIYTSTTTYYEKDGTLSFMGHGITPPITSTDLYLADITEIVKNSSDNIGYLKTSPILIKKIGFVLLSADNIREERGVLYNPSYNDDKYLLAFPYEIKSAPAKIILDLDGSGNKEYNIKIDEVIYDDKGNDFCFTITDLRLLLKTNGIVHGMSGAPIVQNNKIVGAIHSVDVENHKHGYASCVVF